MRIVFATPGLLTDKASGEGKRARRIIGACTKVVGKARLEPGAVVFDVVGAFDRTSPAKANARALEALMRCLTDLNSLYLSCRPETPPLYESGVVYERTTVWDTIPALYGRQYGDCKSLAASRVAELRRLGVSCRPVFRFNESERMTMFHILVMHGDGSFEDPSKVLGMQAPQEAAI